jgi:hypothetical protein
VNRAAERVAVRQHLPGVGCSERLCENSENTILKNEKVVRITLAENKNAL